MSAAAGPWKHQLARSIVIATLIATPALMSLHAGVMSDPDIWWHLRTGEWIVQHHAVPHVDPFSIFGMGKPWQAYSWLFELVVYQLFQRWGLLGIVLYTSLMVAAITAAIFHLLDRLQPDFTKSALLTVSAVVCLSGILTPRPWMFTILFVIVELDILMQARKTGRIRELFLLPLLFALWASIHIQFIDGLVVLGIAAIEPLAERWWPFRSTQLRARTAWAVFTACAAATLVNPYGVRVYQVAIDLVTQSRVADIITELKPLGFRDAADFVLLFVALAAAGALAWTRRASFFETALLAAAAYLSFHSMRDKWFLAVAACTILASAIGGEEKLRIQMPVFALPAAFIAACAAILAAIPFLGVNNTGLGSSLAAEFPVDAVEAIQKQHLTGRIFSDFDWGGFLIWWLRQPVSIDGRSPVHGDERVVRNVDTWNGKPGWDSDPDLAAASLVVAPIQLPLAQLLRLDPAFTVVYQDKVAAVFIRKPGTEKPSGPRPSAPAN